MATRRFQIHGRSILTEGRKLHVRGVTYGTFRPSRGLSFPALETVRRDFEAMAEAGANALRTYVPPPLWLLDLANQCGLKVMVGLAWEQHVAFLDDPEQARAILAEVGRQVRECEAHPAILCYALGNEIPAPIVRWHGKNRIERFLERLYREGEGGGSRRGSSPTSTTPPPSTSSCRSSTSWPSTSSSRRRTCSRPTSRACRTSPGIGRC